MNKKQIAAHLEPSVAASAKRYCSSNDLTIQELMAMSINGAVAARSRRGPLLKVARDRIFIRKKSPAKVRTEGPECRTGLTRVAAYFPGGDVERLRGFSKEYGVSIETLVREGLSLIIGSQKAVVPE